MKIEKAAGPVALYHLNCEHGTGDAICEFSGANNINVYGFKTEGNTVALDIVGCTNVSLFGTGGCGCVPNSTVGKGVSLYQVRGNSSGVLLANVVGQGSRRSPAKNNPFGEAGCDPSRETRVRWEEGGVTTPVLDRPVLFWVGERGGGGGGG